MEPEQLLKVAHIGTMFMAVGVAVGTEVMAHRVANTGDAGAIRTYFAQAGRVITLVPEDERPRVANRVDDELPTVHADRALLERVVANLVSNALNADTEHVIVVAADRRSDGHIELQVIDHGPGLSDTQREAAFRPFHRFEDRGASSGIGLGLPICAGFCEAMGAELDLDATPGGGLTARVVLEPTR